MLIMFLGDSITDWFRDHSDPESLGKGYVKYAAEILKNKYPFLKFRNLGVNGYSTEKVVNLLNDFDDEIKPDIVSIMVGVNDFCDIHKPKDWKPDLEATEKNYETIFREIKEKLGSEILVLQPYLAGEHHPYFDRANLEIVHKKLETEMKKAELKNFVPLDKLINEHFPGKKASVYSKDGVHPQPAGAEYVGGVVAEYMEPIIEKLISKAAE